MLLLLPLLLLPPLLLLLLPPPLLLLLLPPLLLLLPLLPLLLLLLPLLLQPLLPPLLLLLLLLLPLLLHPLHLLLLLMLLPLPQLHQLTLGQVALDPVHYRPHLQMALRCLHHPLLVPRCEQGKPTGQLHFPTENAGTAHT